MSGDEENQGLPPLPPMQVMVPYMSKARFAELVGVDVGVVDAWVDRRYLPTRLVGKYRLINLALLWQQAFQEPER